MKLLITAVAALAFAFPSTAQVTGATGGSASQIETGQSSAPEGQRCERGKTVNGERCICRRIEVESSSRMSIRSVCMTASQWREFERTR